VFQPGQSTGVCGGVGSGSAACGQYGQACSASMPCCGTDPCIVPDGSNTPCPAGQTTGCVCETAIIQ
jgi:hypothetical protein